MAPALALTPTRATPASLTRILTARQVVTTVVMDDPDEGGTNLTGGAIAGIVIGSIAGFLLLLWILRSCFNLGKPNQWGRTFGSPDPEPDRRPAYAYHHETHGSRSRHRHHHHHHHSRSPRRSVEIREVTAIHPARYESRGRSPAAPPAAYSPYGAREARRHSRSSRYY